MAYTTVNNITDVDANIVFAFQNTFTIMSVSIDIPSTALVIKAIDRLNMQIHNNGKIPIYLSI